MSFDYVRRCLLPDLPVHGLAHVVLLILASHANDRGECWVSVGTIAAAARSSDRRAQSSLRALVELKLLEIRPGGPRGCNVYRLTLPAAGDASVIAHKRRPRGPRPFPVEPRGDASVTTGDASVTPTPASPGATPAVVGGDATGNHGATAASPEAVKPQEADAVAREAATAADDLVVIEGVDDPEPDPDADFPERLAAVERRGGFLTMHGRDIRSEWIVPTRGHTPAQVDANVLRWQVRLPTGYANRRLAEEREGQARAASAKRAAAERRALAEQAAQDRAKLDQGANLTARTDRLAKRLHAWLQTDPDGREVAAAIAESQHLRSALDLMRSGGEGNFFGQTRLQSKLSGRPQALLTRFIAAARAEVDLAAASG